LNTRTSVLCFLAVYPLGAGAVPAQKDFPPLLVESQETAAALEAAPEHLRQDAGVYVLTSMGYHRVRESRNGFNCLIERDLPGAFEPRCFDAEGSVTLLPVVFYRAEQRARGATRAYIDREVKERYQKGEFIAPRRVGICYMLSTRNAVIDGDKVSRVGPRLLFYAPNLSNADLGSTPDLESRMIVVDEASATAMIAVPVTSARRTRVNYLSPDDMTPLSQAPEAARAESGSRDALGGQPHVRCSLNQADNCTLPATDR
jgi:hypothetical protein